MGPGKTLLDCTCDLGIRSVVRVRSRQMMNQCREAIPPAKKDTATLQLQNHDVEQRTPYS